MVLVLSSSLCVQSSGSIAPGRIKLGGIGSNENNTQHTHNTVKRHDWATQYLFTDVDDFCFICLFFSSTVQAPTPGL